MLGRTVHQGVGSGVYMGIQVSGGKKAQGRGGAGQGRAAQEATKLIVMYQPVSKLRNAVQVNGTSSHSMEQYSFEPSWHKSADCCVEAFRGATLHIPQAA